MPIVATDRSVPAVRMAWSSCSRRPPHQQRCVGEHARSIPLAVIWALTYAKQAVRSTVRPSSRIPSNETRRPALDHCMPFPRTTEHSGRRAWPAGVFVAWGQVPRFVRNAVISLPTFLTDLGLLFLLIRL